MNKSVYNGGTDAKAGKRAGTSVEFNFGDIVPISVVFF